MTETAKPEGGWDDGALHPLMVDQPEGYEYFEPPLHQMQVKQDGVWKIFQNPRDDREQVTAIQAYHLAENPSDLGIRVLTKRVIWTVEEVPGHGAKQTSPEKIIARNDEATKRRLAKNDQTQQASA